MFPLNDSSNVTKNKARKSHSYYHLGAHKYLKKKVEKKMLRKNKVLIRYQDLESMYNQIQSHKGKIWSALSADFAI